MLQMLSRSQRLVGFRVIGGRLTSPIKEVTEELMSHIAPAKLGKVFTEFISNFLRIRFCFTLRFK